MSRYPGTRPFSDSPDDVARFFGRDAEAEELYLRVLSVPLLVQFGNSGLGKTSLLQAGLFPRLRQKPFLPVMIRLNNAEESLTAAVTRAIRESCQSEGIEPSYRSAEGLWELLSSLTVWRDDLLLTPVLVFDQFEEVFTLRDAAFRAEIATELGALASGIPPARAAGTRRPMVKVLISLREDYLGALEEFSAAIPGLFQERLRLGPMTEEAAREAITGPARVVAPGLSPPFDFDPAALDLLIAELKGRSGVIEPFQLQLLARHAETIAARKGGGTLAADDFRGTHDFESVLKNFYRNTLRGVAQRAKAQRLVEEGLLGAAGHRLMLEERQIRSDYGVAPETLHALESSRLLRRERRLESVFYEISHDRLADSIFRGRSWRVPRNVRVAIWVAAALALVIVGALVWGNLRVTRERDEAEHWLSVLLGEEFFGALRDSGRSTVSKRLQEQVAAQSQADVGSELTRGLALRNHGDIVLIEGTLAEALESFHAALGELKSAPDDASVRREIARTHDRIGETLARQGRLTEALQHYGSAIETWKSLFGRTGAPVTRDDCMSLAESRVAAASLHVRMGRAAPAIGLSDEAFATAFAALFDPRWQCGARGPVLVQRDPDARALQILSMIAFVTNAGEANPGVTAGAAELASSARALRPPSIRATNLELTTLLYRGATRGDMGALQDYRRVLADLNALQQWDPDNRSWQNDGAVVQVLIAQTLTGKPETLDEAEIAVAEALATLRTLHQADAGNLSVLDHLVEALRTHAVVLAARGPTFRAQSEARFDEAEHLLANRRGDAGGLEKSLQLGRLLVEKAKALEQFGEPAAAIATLQRADGVLESAMNAHPDDLTAGAAVYAARKYEAELRRRTGDAAGADAATARARALFPRFQRFLDASNGLVTTLGRASERRGAGVALLESNPAAALRELQASETLLRDSYIRRRPTELEGYTQLTLTYVQMHAAYERLGRPDDRLAAIAASMRAAEVTRAIASTPEEQRSANERLLVTHNLASQSLLAQKRYVETLDVLHDVMLLGQELLAAPEPDGVALGILGDTKCGMASIERHLQSAGWQETLRGGLAYLRKATALDPGQEKKLRYWTAYASEGTATAGSRPSGSTRP